MKTEHKYSSDAVNKILSMLSQLEVRGVENASILISIYNIVNNPLPIDTTITEVEEG